MRPRRRNRGRAFGPDAGEGSSSGLGPRRFAFRAGLPYPGSPSWFGSVRGLPSRGAAEHDRTEREYQARFADRPVGVREDQGAHARGDRRDACEGTEHPPNLHPHAGHSVFFPVLAGSSPRGVLRRGRGVSRLDPDAEPSRKERDHRGVRSRHRNRGRAFGPDAGEGSSSGPGPRRFYVPGDAPQYGRGTPDRMGAETSTGTTGFDMAGSCGWWRVEVPGGLVKHPGKP